MGEMGWQDEKCLDEGDEENEHGDIREDLDQLVVPCRDEEERHESDHGCQDADCDRTGDSPYAGKRRIRAALALLAFRRDTLPHHDGIVDDNADQQEEREQRSHVESQVRTVKEHERTDKGQWNSDRHPERNAKIEEQDQAHQHQDRPDGAIADDLGKTVEDRLDPVAPDSCLRTKGRLVAGKPTLDTLRDVNKRLSPGCLDSHEDRWLPVDFGKDVVPDKAVGKGRHIAQSHDGAIIPGDQGNVLEILGIFLLAEGVENHTARVGSQFAKRQIDRGPAKLCRHTGHGQVVVAQFLLVNLNGDFPRTRSIQPDHGDSRQREQLIADAFGHLAQGVLGKDRRRYRQRHDFAGDLLDFYCLVLGRSRRKSLDAVDGVLDIRKHGILVGEGLEFDLDPGDTRRCRADDSGDPRKTDHAFLDTPIYVLLDLSGRGAR